jgi:hypothetical protein
MEARAIARTTRVAQSMDSLFGAVRAQAGADIIAPGSADRRGVGGRTKGVARIARTQNPLWFA